MIRFISKILNLPTALRIKFYPSINRMILRTYGAVLGKNIQIPGKVHWLIRGARFVLVTTFISLLVML